MLQLDDEIYTNLKKEKQNQWSKLNDNMKGFQLDGDLLIQLHFSNVLDNVSNTTIASNDGDKYLCHAYDR